MSSPLILRGIAEGFNPDACEIREGATAFIPFEGYAVIYKGRCIAHCANRVLCAEVIRDYAVNGTNLDPNPERRW